MIETFKTIMSQRQWEDATCGNILRNVEKRLTKNSFEELRLTKFQRKAIADPAFWRDWDAEDVSHLMIQGATSAGKTLLSELNVIDTLNRGLSAIVLVPLKAMVHERTKNFRQDMTLESEDKEIAVFGASSDYMENDERLIAGDYDVAIIVYEKFFAMLSQGGEKLMRNCGLLVIDELSMLSQEQRGPKLEMALEIVKGKFPSVRMMALATCDCTTEKFCNWLDIEKPIRSTARPVSLVEHILTLDGSGKRRFIPADVDLFEDVESEAVEEREEKIDPGLKRPDLKPEEKKRALLLAVLKDIYSRTPDARIMIFVDTQRRANAVAGFLKENASEYFVNGCDNREFMEKVRSCESDDLQKALIDSYLPWGIAYHHSGISTNLREIIEEEFQKKESSLRAVVATETLTVGVNLPVDVMIMMYHTVPRGTGQNEPLSTQEYRNYIGRAGRLGLSDRNGESYLLLEDGKLFDRYWNSYRKRAEILSSLTKSDEKRLAPFYLALIYNRVGSSDINGTKFTDSQLTKIYESSFAKYCGLKNFDPSKLYSFLFEHYMASEKTVLKLRSGSDSAYAVDAFGEHMAKYALSLETCASIYNYFYAGYDDGGLPLGITAEDLNSDRYLLDILYHVCMHPEIASSTNLTYQSDGKSTILKALNAIVGETDSEGNPVCSLFCDNEDEKKKERNDLWMLLNRSNLPDETEKLQAAMRSILLYYWTKGMTVEEIRKKTGFLKVTRVISGDIERLAEVVSFHLDAILSCLRTAVKPVELTRVLDDASMADRAFYALQTRIKYGMPRDLVEIANKHVHGLDRSNLLKLKKKADEYGLTPKQYVFTAPQGELQENRFMSLSQQTQLFRAFEQRCSTTKFDTLMSIVKKDAGSELGENDIQALEIIAAWGGTGESFDPGVIYDALKDLRKARYFGEVSFSSDGSPSKTFWTCGSKTIRLGIAGSADEKTLVNAKKFFFDDNDGNTRAASILVVPHSLDPAELDRAYKISRANAVVDNIYFVSAIARSIHCDIDSGGVLTAFLSDLRGIFTSVNGYYPISQYAPKRIDEKENSAHFDFRIVSGARWVDRSGIPENEDRLIDALSKEEDLKNFEELPWGDEIEKALDDPRPTLIMIERKNVLFSASINKLIYHMRNHGRQNSLIAFFSDKAREKWYEPGDGEPGNEWNTQYGKIDNFVMSDIESAVERIRNFVTSYREEKYLVGVSYAHYGPESKRDEDLILKLAEKLRDVYGEERILYDRFSPAKKLFEKNRAKEESLNAYRECRAYVILWNYWTEQNGNCCREREVILSCCADSKRLCLFLAPEHSDRPVSDPPSPNFSQTLSDSSVDSFVRQIKEFLDAKNP